MIPLLYYILGVHLTGAPTRVSKSSPVGDTIVMIIGIILNTFGSVESDKTNLPVAIVMSCQHTFKKKISSLKERKYLFY